MQGKGRKKAELGEVLVLARMVMEDFLGGQGHHHFELDDWGGSGGPVWEQVNEQCLGQKRDGVHETVQLP